MTKFKLGDKVKVIKYGSLLWYNKLEWKLMLENKLTTSDKPNNILGEDDNFWFCDMQPNLVGQIGIVSKVDNNQYALEGISTKSAWYFGQQLELLPSEEVEELLNWLGNITNDDLTNIIATDCDALQIKLLNQVKSKIKEIWKMQ